MVDDEALMASQLLRAQTLLAQGEWDLAEQSCRALLAQSPDLAAAVHVLACLLVHRNSAEAGAWLQRAVQLEPDNTLYRLDYVRWLAMAGQLPQALSLCRQVLALFQRKPALQAQELSEVYLLAGNLLRDLGQHNEAIVHYRQAISLQPQALRAVLNLGDLLHESGRDAAAVLVYRAALVWHADSAGLHNQLGVSLQALSQLDAAQQHYRQAVALAPDFVLAWHNLARLCGQTQCLEAAHEAYTALLALQPEHQEFQLARANLCPRVARHPEQTAAHRAGLHQTLDALLKADFVLDLKRVLEWHVHPSPLLAYQGEDDLPLQQKYAALFRRALPVQPKMTVRTRLRQARIGLVVTAHEALFLRWLGPLIPYLIAQEVRLTVICRVAALPGLHAALPPPQPAFLALDADLAGAASQIAQLDCDLLYYWESGTDSLNYFLPFFRLANLQCHGFGWPISSCAPEMDVCFASAATETPDNSTAYAEQLIRLEPLLTFGWPHLSESLPAGFKTRAEFGLPSDARLYLCCQDAAKLQPDWDRLVARILAQDPQGLLLLTTAEQSLLLPRLQAAGADPERIWFFSQPAYADLLSLLHLADVVLDSTHFSGASTTLEALVCGTPVITLPGRFQRGRYTLACYQTLGLSEPVALDAGDYVQRAVGIACDPARRQALSQQIQAALPRLFAQDQAVAALGDAMLELIG